MAADIDVLVPVHSASRPIARLAESVLAHTTRSVRLLVIAHNIDERLILEALGEHAADPRVEVVGFRDGIGSPAGPMDFALDLVTAPWFTKIDSDDYLAPGALDAWIASAEKEGAEIVLPPMLLPLSGEGFPTPPRRVLRRRLHPLRDRLSYRTSTMGLISTRLRDHARPEKGMETGEDVAPSIRLWFTARGIVAASGSQAYLVGEDAVDRVTESGRPFTAELAFVPRLLTDPVWSRLTAQTRAAVVRKIIRVHVLGALGRRAVDRDDISAAASTLEELLRAAPEALRALSRLDNELIAAVRRTEEPRLVVPIVERRRRYAQVSAIATPRFRHCLGRDAPLRFLAASQLARVRARRAARAA